MNTYLNDILEDLCNFALSHGISITLSHEFTPAMKSLADTKNRKILINTLATFFHCSNKTLERGII